jgi:hypothetical protein
LPKDVPVPMRRSRFALETREAYLVKRRSFPDSDVSRFTNDEAGLFEHPARGAPAVLDVRTIEVPPCHNSFSADS